MAWQEFGKPWLLIWIPENGEGVVFRCQVCDAALRPHSQAEADAFVATHAEHRAPGGGLGDLVAAFAKPVARLLGYEPECTPCERRRRELNRMKWFGR